MVSRRRGIRTWTAGVAIYALFLHAIIAGLAGGALASPFDFQVICASDGTQAVPAGHGDPDGRGGPSGHSHIADCCLSGCPAVGGHVVLPTAVIFTRLADDRPVTRFLEGSTLGAGHKRSPINPRGPPIHI